MNLAVVGHYTLVARTNDTELGPGQDRISDPWGPRTPYGPHADASSAEAAPGWPSRVDSYLEPGVGQGDVERWVQTASVLHSNGDAYDFAVRDGRIVGVRGRESDRVNRGRLDPKDMFGWQSIGHPDRLRQPLARIDGRLVEVDWETAMSRIVDRSEQLLASPGGWGRIGFYSSGQLSLEDYYTLGVIGKAGIGTPHMDGNTRLCTATAAAALKASFGTDGQPGSYSDIDVCDALALWGHNIAETQVVTWDRMLDRRGGPNPPRMLVVDPRTTITAAEADIHLANRIGTNLALVNGLIRELLERGWYDDEYIAAHTIGFEALEQIVSSYTPRRVEEICDVPAAQLVAAAELIGTSRRLFSTVLQGFYQSNQATASACAVNNIHLLRGMIGKPGAGLCQMNGQPTAQNNRECGADGDLPGFRNWANPEHVHELAQLWNVDEMIIPHWAPPTHAMQIFRYAEQGSLRMLWIIATNPAVSMPDLTRIRRILAKEELFVIVQDPFMSETAALADVVLPAATWGEKTGTFTNADRTVHLSEKAIEPPGEARTDLDIFLDYARRMGFRNKDGGPLITWDDAESAFEAWKACSRGRPCDYSGLTYDMLRGPSGIQWPCNATSPHGTERLYVDSRFNTDPATCETYGQDFVTGAAATETEYRAKQPDGRAFLHAVDYQPPPETASVEHPFTLTTGRNVYHFHTRTKTGRSPELQAAAPNVWVEIHPDDAAANGIGEDDRVRIENSRGHIDAKARLVHGRRGEIFVPFHYGSANYGPPEDAEHGSTAANELTLTAWDPVSRQPSFKLAAASIRRIDDPDGDR